MLLAVLESKLLPRVVLIFPYRPVAFNRTIERNVFWNFMSTMNYYIEKSTLMDHI